MEQLGSHGEDFYEIWYLRGPRKPAEEIKVLLKYDKNNGHLHEGRSTWWRSWLRRVRLLVAPLESFINIILPAVLCPWDRPSLEQK